MYMYVYCCKYIISPTKWNSVVVCLPGFWEVGSVPSEATWGWVDKWISGLFLSARGRWCSHRSCGGMGPMSSASRKTIYIRYSMQYTLLLFAVLQCERFFSVSKTTASDLQTPLIWTCVCVCVFLYFPPFRHLLNHWKSTDHRLLRR